MILNSIAREDDFYVKARDGKDIFVRGATSSKNTSNKAVVIAHGIPGNPNEYIHVTARNFFTEKGYDVYRMSFYDDGNNARKLHTTTLPLQANDLDDVVNTLKTKHDNVYVCGHSYGGATTFFANPKARAIAFWDSSFGVWNYWDEFEKDEQSFEKELIGKSQRIYQLYNKEMMRHAQEQNEESIKNLISKVSSPSIIITSAEDYFLNNGEIIYQFLTCEKDYKQVQNADHQFTNGHTVQELLKETLNWFERH